MKTKFIISLAILVLPFAALCQQPVKLDNPFNKEFVRSKMRKTSPRLILTPAIEKNLRNRLVSDPVVKNYYTGMKLAAAEIIKKPVLTYDVIGRRLLGTSREMLKRMTILSMVYRMEKDPAVLKKIDEELLAVCNFPDWHPSHFLDVAEMSLAVAIAVDWTGSWLPEKTVALARKCLVDYGINASFGKNDPGWVYGTNNWNQVCNGGMIAAAIVIGDNDPALAARTISRSLDGMPSALKQYSPDGVYPEGTTYWDYGTSFSCVTSSILESAFGKDFGINSYPAFLKSAEFRLLSAAPSGRYFNFADCGDREGRNGDITLAWFAAKTGNPLFLQKEKFLKPAENAGSISRLAGAGLVWLSQFNAKEGSTLPPAWKGDGSNPIFIFRTGGNDSRGYYFAGKGGKGNLSHGNLDAGSFIFELDGVRWSVDPGNQDYNELEQEGFDLWNQFQNSPRWTLLTKGNQSHSTLTVNESRFIVNAACPIVEFQDGEKPSAVVNLTPVYGNRMEKATRKFTKDTDHSIIIEDNIILGDSVNLVTWAMMTTADVSATEDGAILRQDGKEILLKISSPSGLAVSTIMMDPPPLRLDRRIPGLKKIEIRIPAYIFNDGKGVIRVRLTSPE